MDARSPVYSLSAELLHCCFEYAISTDHVETDRENQKLTWGCCGFELPSYKTAYALSLTCRLFHQITQPLLYRDVNITKPCQTDTWVRRKKENWYKWKAISRENSFSRFITARPELRYLAKSFSAEFTTFLRLAELSSAACAEDGFANLERLSLQHVPTVDEPGVWDHPEEQSERARADWRHCEECLTKLPKLVDLSLNGYSLRFGNLHSMLKISTLQRLTLSNIDYPQPRGLGPGESIMHARNRVQEISDTAAQPPLGFEGRSALTDLRLLSPAFTSPKGLKNYLRWLRSLEKFTFGLLFVSNEDMGHHALEDHMSYRWDFWQLHEALEHQRTSLRELRIHQIQRQEGLENFSLHEFPALELFQVNANMMNRGVEAVDATSFWLTPSLKKLVLQYSRSDSEARHMWTFCASDVEWLGEFARIAAQLKRSECIGLEEIEILFEPQHDFEVEWQGFSDGEHSQSLFVEAKDVVEGHGIKLTHPTDMSVPPPMELDYV